MLKPTRVGFKGIGELVVTFKTDVLLSKRDEGKLVKVNASDTVVAAGDNDLFIGQMLKHEDRGTCSVQIGGYFELTYTGAAPGLGYQVLVADADGQVKAVEADGKGVSVRVVRLDKGKKTVGFFI